MLAFVPNSHHRTLQKQNTPIKDIFTIYAWVPATTESQLSNIRGGTE